MSEAIFGPTPQTADDYRVLADEALAKADTMRNPEHAIAQGLRGIGYAILAAIAPETSLSRPTEDTELP